MAYNVIPLALSIYQAVLDTTVNDVGPFTTLGVWTTIRSVQLTSYGGTVLRVSAELGVDVVDGAAVRVTVNNGATLLDNGTGLAQATLRQATQANLHMDRYFSVPVTGSPTTYTVTLDVTPEGAPNPSITVNAASNARNRAILFVIEGKGA